MININQNICQLLHPLVYLVSCAFSTVQLFLSSFHRPHCRLCCLCHWWYRGLQRWAVTCVGTRTSIPLLEYNCSTIPLPHPCHLTESYHVQEPQKSEEASAADRRGGSVVASAQLPHAAALSVAICHTHTLLWLRFELEIEQWLVHSSQSLPESTSDYPGHTSGAEEP